MINKHKTISYLYMPMNNFSLNTYNLKERIKYDPREILPEDTDTLCSRIEHGLINDYCGYRIAGAAVDCETAANGLITYFLEPDSTEHLDTCPHCGMPIVLSRCRKNGYAEHTVKDCPKAGRYVQCRLTKQRYFCPHCKRSFTVDPPFVHPVHHITLRLFAEVRRLLDHNMTFTDIASLTGLGCNIIAAIDKAYLSHEFVLPDLSQVRNIGIDENSYAGGYASFVTFIYDLDTVRLLYVCDGRTKEAV